jgi:hypothetical protein
MQINHDIAENMNKLLDLILKNKKEVPRVEKEGRRRRRRRR